MKSRKLISVTVEMTKKCNHKCIHCYNPETHCNDKLLEPTKEKLNIIFEQLVECKVERVTITGGEPLLYKELLFYFIDQLNQAGIETCLNTNLTLISMENAEKLYDLLGKDNMIFASIPSVTRDKCDSITRVKGSYDKILRGIKICRESGILIGLNMSVSNSNTEDIDNIDNFLVENPVDCFSLFKVIPPIYDRKGIVHITSSADVIKIADTLLEIHKKHGIIVGSVRPLPKCIIGNDKKYSVIRSSGCTTGKSRCAIDVASGNIEACSQEAFCYGNIYKDYLSECFAKMEKWCSNCYLLTECCNCDKLDECGGVCQWDTACFSC